MSTNSNPAKLACENLPAAAEPQSDIPRTRAEINRANAQSSTGPRTEDGKNASRYNARRHGLSGQCIIMPGDDLAAFQDSGARLAADFRPDGEFESQLVQSLASAQWQLDRARAIETNILFLGASKRTKADDPTRDFDFDQALGLAETFLEQAKQLDLISRYATRYHRQVLQIHDRLRQVQKERRNHDSDRKRHHNEDFSKRQQGHRTQRNQSHTATPGFVSQTGENVAESDRKSGQNAGSQPKTIHEIAVETNRNNKNKAA